MTTRLLVLLLGILISAPSVAQNGPSDVTDQEIAKYKALAVSSCQDAGVKNGDPQEKVEAFCGCLISTITKTMTRAEWQRAYFHSLKGQAQDERQVLEPHLKNVAVCAPPPAAQDQQPAPKPPGTGGLNLRPPR